MFDYDRSNSIDIRSLISLKSDFPNLLGPQLCSDCIEIQTRSNLSSENLPWNLIRQRLSALAIRSFIPNEKYLTDDHLYQMIHNQQIQVIRLIHFYLMKNIFINYLHPYRNIPIKHLFIFLNLKDLSEKYSRNEYPHLNLSENPPPKSSNPLFKQTPLEKFDISHKYSSVKRASIVKPPILKSNSFAFISSRKSEEFNNQHRFLSILVHLCFPKVSKKFSMKSSIY